MAKAIFVSFREKAPEELYEKLNIICKELEADNIISEKPFVYVDGIGGYGIMNPPSDLMHNEGSFLLGKIFASYKKWYLPNSDIPDGTFALFRSNENYVELCTDILATRTIWYYFDEQKIIASTSQRAIVMFLGSFSFNSAVIPWMISTGTIGYSNSYDTRIKKLEADTILKINRLTWKLDIESNKVEFESIRKTNIQLENELFDALEKSIKELNVSMDEWALPLSGGYDSRAILLFLQKNYSGIEKLKSYTWGLNSSRKTIGSDGYVAEKLSKSIGISNEYLSTDFEEKNIDEIINRFVKLGEGRISNISAYLDGFSLWKNLYNKGTKNILRGDEAFGWSHLGYFKNEDSVRKSVKCYKILDFTNIAKFPSLKILSQELPQNLKRKENENFENYRDRLYQQYRISTVLSALSDLKLSYVEISNPLISKKIIKVVRQLKPDQRTEKQLVKKIINKLSPPVPYAKYDSIEDENKVFKTNAFVEIFNKEFNANDKAKELFPPNIIDYIIKNLKVNNFEETKTTGNISFKVKLLKNLPIELKETIKFFLNKHNLEVPQMAFRILLVRKMFNQLTKDSQRIPN